jgi:hypothetical protein
MEDDPQDMLIHPGVQAIHGQINWELGQQMVQEILQPEPQKEVAENVVNEVEANENVEVQIPVIPNDNFLHMMIPEEEFMGHAEMQETQENQVLDHDHLPQDEDEIFHNNIQIGMVRTFFQTPPPNLPWKMNLTDNSNIFGLSPSASVLPHNEPKTFLQVPEAWVGFFQALLVAPALQAWAKKLLDTSFPSLLWSERAGPKIAMPLDKLKPAAETCVYLAEEHECFDDLEEAITEQIPEETPTGMKRARKPRASTPLVETMVRRSNRMKASNNGFKPDTCKVKNCLGCSSAPPTLSPTFLKKIGASICQVDPEKLEEAKLLKKKTTDPVGKKPRKDPETNKEDNDDSSN